MIPLLIHENYLAAISHGVQQRGGPPGTPPKLTLGGPRGPPKEAGKGGPPGGPQGGPSAELEGLTSCARAARALCQADVANAILRSVHKVNGFIPRVNFPSWLGRNSTQTKNKRLFSELLLQLLKTPSAGSSVGALKLSGYLDALYTMAVAPLAHEGDAQETVKRLGVYGLRREHLVDHMQSLMLKKQVP
ncbi:methyltransferase domain-containing protein, putative [Eimeria tenella]|uniref:Methyltransferase domain-containing protein, putative n=1 Tax=Eimeria tenella TaxID=5802 RepID=U6L8E9_EIMTE|nr:methyltransferase domain-containing protein, putative [Eimeria tenella]CDJ44854.1 methyltransferase domain-containing protein, putative [Eimeria tenella]|eukprot:XP_013235601.1 methyltransferase domain-containing protein, putative [Eimeria tenella]